jgi:hypothetical protein
MFLFSLEVALFILYTSTSFPTTTRYIVTSYLHRLRTLGLVPRFDLYVVPKIFWMSNMWIRSTF